MDYTASLHTNDILFLLWFKTNVVKMETSLLKVFSLCLFIHSVFSSHTLNCLIIIVHDYYLGLLANEFYRQKITDVGRASRLDNLPTYVYA